jgi:hypothetical protein
MLVQENKKSVRVDIAAWRLTYAKQIKKYWDNGNSIYYINKMWVDRKLTFCKYRQKMKSLAFVLTWTFDRFIMLHVGGINDLFLVHNSFTRLSLQQETTMDK